MPGPSWLRWLSIRFEKFLPCWERVPISPQDFFQAQFFSFYLGFGMYFAQMLDIKVFKICGYTYNLESEILLLNQDNL